MHLSMQIKEKLFQPGCGDGGGCPLTFIPSTWSVGKRQTDLWVQGQSSLQSEFQDSQGYTEKPCLEKPKPGWRGGSVVKSTDCSSSGPEFNSQHPHGDLPPSTMGSDALFWCVWRQLQCTHINKVNLKETKQYGPCMHVQLRASVCLGL